MRPLDDWDRSDLQALIDGQVQEWLQLDYKASEALQNTDGKKAEIAKDVSAFANSAGGRIIYGIVEDKRYPVRIDDGSDPTRITKEWIENVILSGISPRVDGVRVKEIALKNDLAAFVVDIPQASSRAPHQAHRDKRYYKRHEFQSVPMEDYEIKDVMRRSSRPELVVWMEFKNRKYDAETDTFTAELEINIGNRSPEPATFASIRLMIESEMANSAPFQFEELTGVVDHHVEGRIAKIKQFSRNVTPSHHLPIYREQPINLCRLAVRMRRGVAFMIAYVVTAPGFSRTRTFILRDGSDIHALPENVADRHIIPENW